LGSKFLCSEGFHGLSFVFLLKETEGKVEGCKGMWGGDRKKTASVCPKRRRLAFFKLYINIQFPSTQRRDSVSIQQHKPVNSVGEKISVGQEKVTEQAKTHCVEK
jgi:hypothetical protein